MSTKGIVVGQDGGDGGGIGASGTSSTPNFTVSLGFTPRFFILRSARAFDLIVVEPTSYSLDYETTDAYGTGLAYSAPCYGANAWMGTSQVDDNYTSARVVDNGGNSFTLTGNANHSGTITWDAIA